MFLKSLVLRGFKSFPDKTTLVFEPGVTVIVGPNGSGKTNVIDAVSWVLGEQGPKSLRGGKMEDVIFAGSPQRPALGMTEVTLVIDNSAGLLPIEFTEVTISRTLFRSGESEYRLNGQQCRLLDIQEVLSDTGIGREQHTIVGQGQLDFILQSDPMQMRAFIEEAAGIAKHRRRKDRALRRIAAAEQNIGRLFDLLGEIRRQLRPLREQAEVAKRHAALSEELSRVRLISASRELAAVRSRMGTAGGADPEMLVRLKEDELSKLEQSLTEAEHHRSEQFTRSEKFRETAWALSRAAERLTALTRLAAEREKTIEAELGAATEGRLRARLEEAARDRAAVEKALRESSEALAAADQNVATRRAALDAAAARVRSIESELAPLRTGRRESIAEAVRVRGEIAALSGSLEAAERESSRLRARLVALERSRDQAMQELENAREAIRKLESQEEPLTGNVQQFESELQRLEAERSSEERRLREMERKAALWKARADVHAAEPTARRIAAEGLEGVAGVLADLIDVPAQYRKAVAAVAGPLQSVLVVRDSRALSRVLREVAADEGVGILVAEHEVAPVSGATPLLSVVGALDASAEAAIRGVYLAEDVLEAARLAASNPGAVFVTRDGAVAAGALVARGPADAAERAAELEEELKAREIRVSELDREIRRNRTGLEENAQQLNEVDAALAAAGERIASLDREIHAADREIGVVGEQEGQARESVSSLTQRVEALRGELPRLESGVGRAESEVERLQQEHAHALAAQESTTATHEDARIAAGRAAERKLVIEERARAITFEIEKAEAAAAGLEGKRRELAAALRDASEVGRTAALLRESAEGWANEADRTYREARALFDHSQAVAERLRTERAGLVGALGDLRAVARREEEGRSELRVRSRILEERIREEWQIEPDQAVTRYGHLWEVEDQTQLSDPVEKTAAMDPDALSRKRVRLERDIETVGQVNPLAAQEFQALSEREEFLTEQIADVRASRRDLMKVVAAVDERIRELFLTAFEDVAREYERLFTLLFPGGQGRLRLSDPADPMETGVEVEARPGGKNLKRLSLLSGGERALSALAFLFAIFSARPSPFYVLDEVEAALDDINLHRFLTLLNDFRQTSQLLVVTHQKRTMEVADVLYGVSIRPDGASRVISQKLSLNSGSPEEALGRIPTEG